MFQYFIFHVINERIFYFSKLKFIFSFKISFSSSLKSSLWQKLRVVGRNMQPVATTNTNVVSSWKKTASHAYWYGTKILMTILKAQKFFKNFSKEIETYEKIRDKKM